MKNLKHRGIVVFLKLFTTVHPYVREKTNMQMFHVFHRKRFDEGIDIGYYIGTRMGSYIGTIYIFINGADRFS